MDFDETLLARQTIIQDRCFHPLHGFIEFDRSEIEQSVNGRFEKQAHLYPHHLAVVTDDQRYTYEELNRAANQIARLVRERCGDNPAPVALLLEHGAPIIIALLGVLKAGKIYVALDPAFPEARTSYIVADTQAQLLLTNNANYAAALNLMPNEAQLLNIDAIEEDVASTNLAIDIAPDDIAYIIYTSGSTGQPKGVYQNHRNLLHNIMQYTNTLHLSRHDRFTLLYSCSVNGSLRDIFGSLLNGASLHTFDVKSKGLADLSAWLMQEKITFYHSVPTVFRHFIDSLTGSETFPELRLIRFGGERVPAHYIDWYKQFFSADCILYAGMGATETSTVRQCFIDKETVITTSVVPTGYAVAERPIILLDDNGRSVPPGEVGIIAVKSRYLALGYWQRPDLTAQVFIPDAEDSQARLYLTGDLGRILPDGRLLHMGRKDAQVNIRGYRVELAEVEKALLAHPAVKESAVAAHPNGADDLYLAGYAVLHQDKMVTASDLHEFLKSLLPDYMIPASFQFVDQMPLTPNSKIDRKALPVPVLTRPALKNQFVLPTTAVQTRLTTIWETILGIQPIGIDDNFFELGGHSLLATQLVSRLRAAFPVAITLADIFAAPTIAELAARLQDWQPTSGDTANWTIAPQPRQPRMPLSFAQQRLWFLTQLEPDSTAYHISVAYRLIGPLNQAALSQSLQKIVQRHESLRTLFGQEAGTPYQTILPEMPLKLHHADLRQTPAPERQAALTQQLAAFNHQPFSLTAGPLLRVALFQLEAEQYVLAIVKHHIISDGSSLGILLEELSQLYKAALRQAEPALPTLPVQYADFAAWQQQEMTEQVLSAQLDYWQKQLAGAPPFLALPADYPRPQKQTFRGGREVLLLPLPLTKQLKALSHQENATLFMVLLAAFQLLLQRLTGQEDIVVGTPIAGRNRTEIENLIGFFINNLVIRSQVSHDGSFQALLAQVREKALGAYAHQDLPFEKLLETLKPERDLGRTPVFQVFFNMLNVELYQLALADLAVERLSRTDRESKFDLTLYAREQADEIHLRLIYNADLFTAVRMAEFLQQFQTLLTQIVAQPGQTVAEYSLLTATARPLLPDPRQPLRETWSAASHTMVSRQARQTPTKTALVDAHASWTYAELEDRSNQLAHCLQASGIAPGDVVAIYADRAASLVWTVLGVLKAGAAFLILDPAYPPERLQTYLMAARPKGWIQLETAVPRPATLTNWLDEAECSQITLPPGPTAVPAAIDQQPTTPPAVHLTADSLAYLIFTSGTTGRPKGILGRHGPLAHFFPWQIETFGLQAADRFSLLSGLAHDPLLRDIFTPLLAGATLFIPTQEEMLQPGRLGHWLARHQISVTHLTPALSQVATMTLANQTAVSLPSLRYAFFGGDRLTQQDVRSLQALAGNVTCVNFYGTTETPQVMAYHTVAPAALGQETAETLVPIGQGIADVQLLLLNAHRQLAGIGELGEIYIRTPHLARGYLGDRSLTQERFVPNPLTDDAADLCYRTGDLGRYTPSGEVLFYGRADRQVKIRGLRLELAEVEAALGNAEGVAQGVVTAVPDAAGQVQLVAYLLLAEERPFSPMELRTALAATLPSYMIPSAFVQLEQLPVTPNGKVDYARLPLPDLANLPRATEYVPPTDALQNQLVNIWEAVLKVRPIGIHDNYFALGGHSLQAITLIAQIEKAFQREVPLAALFQAPTIAELAAVMRQGGKIVAWSSVVPIAPFGSKRPFFCVHGGAGHVYHYRALAQHLGPEQPFYGLQPGGAEQSQSDKVKSMAAAYLKEIRQIQPDGPYYLGGFCFGAIVAFEMAQQLTQSGEQVALVALIDALAPGYNGHVVPPAASAQLNSTPEPTAVHGAELGWGTKLVHLGKKMRLRFRRAFVLRRRYTWQRLTKLGDKLLVRLFEMVKRPLPHRLRNQQMLTVTRTARKQYNPAIYSGNLAVFRRDDVDERIPADMGWRRLTNQTVHIHQIPGKHLELLQEPFVQELAQQLQACLDQSQ